jgi:quinol monooxygenase YgiN
VEDLVGEPWRAAVMVHLRVRVAPDRQDEFRAFLDEAIPFYEAPGGIRISLLNDTSDPERFIELVEYVDAGAYRQDEERVRSDPTMAEYLSRWRSLLSGPPDVETYDRVHVAR